jgi:hypothetical protein
MKKIKTLLFILLLGLIPFKMFASFGMPSLFSPNVEGLYLKGQCGNNIISIGVNNVSSGLAKRIYIIKSNSTNQA